MNVTRRERLVGEIRSAFAREKHPGNNNLVDASSELDLGREAARLVFLDKRWEQVNGDLLGRARGSILTISPAAYRYFLPGFMIAILQEFNPEESAVDEVLYGLSTPDPDMITHRSFARLEGYTQQQRDIIRSFLHFYRDELSDSEDVTLANAIAWWNSVD